MQAKWLGESGPVCINVYRVRLLGVSFEVLKTVMPRGTWVPVDLGLSLDVLWLQRILWVVWVWGMVVWGMEPPVSSFVVEGKSACPLPQGLETSCLHSYFCHTGTSLKLLACSQLSFHFFKVNLWLLWFQRKHKTFEPSTYNSEMSA